MIFQHPVLYVRKYLFQVSAKSWKCQGNGLCFKNIREKSWNSVNAKDNQGNVCFCLLNESKTNYAHNAFVRFHFP